MSKPLTLIMLLSKASGETVSLHSQIIIIFYQWQYSQRQLAVWIQSGSRIDKKKKKKIFVLIR